MTALLLHQATASRRTPRSSTRRSSTTAVLYSAEIEPFTRRRPERRAPAGNKYRAVEVSGGVEKERDYFGRRDDRYDDRRGYDRGYDRRGYDDRDRAFCGVPCAFALALISCAGVERYRPRDRYDDRRRDDYDRRDRGRDDYDRRDRGRDDYDRRDRGRDDYDRRDRGRDDYDRRDDRR